MLRNHVLLFILLLFAGDVLGQDTSKPNMLTALFSFAVVAVKGAQPAIQPGLQWRLRRWSLEANTAFLLLQPRDRYGYVHYWRNSLDIKRYLHRRPYDEPYAGMALAYAVRTFSDTSGTFFIRDRTDRYSFAKARIHTPLATVAFKAGDEVRLGKRFYLDFFGGIGVRIVYTQYQDLENVSPYYNSWFGHIGPLSAYRYDKTITRLHLTGGLRLGYALW